MSLPDQKYNAVPPSINMCPVLQTDRPKRFEFSSRWGLTEASLHPTVPTSLTQMQQFHWSYYKETYDMTHYDREGVDCNVHAGETIRMKLDCITFHGNGRLLFALRYTLPNPDSVLVHARSPRTNRMTLPPHSRLCSRCSILPFQTSADFLVHAMSGRTPD